MTQPLRLEELINRLQARAADASRRTSTRQSEFGAGVRAVDLGALLMMGGSIADQLRGVVAANQTGRVDPAGGARAHELDEAMTSPAPSVLPGPADEARLAGAEASLGVRLPPSLRQVYGAVADGGFGPGEGLLPLFSVIETYAGLRERGAMPRDLAWPDGLLPMVSMDPGWDCVDASTGRVVAWDPDGLGERSSQAAFARSFRVIFPSVEAWLTDWVASRTQAEMMARFTTPTYEAEQARAARQSIGRMAPAERAALGLPEVGWEKVVWGGIGWDDAEPGSD